MMRAVAEPGSHVLDVAVGIGGAGMHHGDVDVDRRDREQAARR